MKGIKEIKKYFKYTHKKKGVQVMNPYFIRKLKCPHFGCRRRVKFMQTINYGNGV